MPLDLEAIRKRLDIHSDPPAQMVCPSLIADAKALLDELTAARAENARLREALKPFAEFLTYTDEEAYLRENARYIGLTGPGGVELTSPYLRRLPATWVRIRSHLQLARDLEFTVPAGTIVLGWRGYPAETGDTELPIVPLLSEAYSTPGGYVLLGDRTGFLFTKPPEKQP